MSLINWNPSKGNPNEYKFGYVDYVIPEIVLEEREFPPRKPLSDEEKAEIDALKEKFDNVLSGDEKEICENDLGDCECNKLHMMKLPQPSEKGPLSGEFRCSYHVETVSTLTMKQADSLLEVKTKDDKPSHRWFDFKPQTLTVELTYPLSKIVKFDIVPFKRIFQPKNEPSRTREIMSPGYVMWAIAQQYKHIYENWEHYGIWGHVMGDLYFEGFNIQPDGKTEVWIGS